MWRHILGILIWSVVALFCIESLIQAKHQSDAITVETNYIRSISYQSDSKADFILGCGSIDRKDYYVCYQVLDDGGIQLMRILAEKVIIYETLDTDDMAYVEIERNGFGITKSIKLYVPIGTIYEQYNFQ